MCIRDSNSSVYYMFTILSCYHAKVKRSKLQTFLHFFPDHFYHLNHQCRHKCQQQNIPIHQHSHFRHIEQHLKNRNAKYQSQKNTSTQKCSHAVLVGPKSNPCHGLLAPAVKPMKQACQCQRCKSHRCCKRGTLPVSYTHLDVYKRQLLHIDNDFHRCLTVIINILVCFQIIFKCKRF